MSTYGQVRLRITKMLPAIDQDLIDGWIHDRYVEILDRLPWQRRELQVTIQTVAPISAGTIALTTGSASVTGTGTSWASTITGLGLWVAGRSEFYEVTYVSGTALSLDRPYEGATATGVAYKVFQSVYALPSDCKILKDVRSLKNGEMQPWDSRSVIGEVFGAPQTWRPMMDATNGQQQIEVWPIPSAVESLAVRYVAEDTSGYDGSDTSVTTLVWVRDAAIVNGVLADGNLSLKDFNSADRYEIKFEKAVQTMIRTECARTPGKPIKLSPRLNAANWTGRSSRHPARSRMPGVWNDQS
jgi:hypothetical protein